MKHLGSGKTYQNFDEVQPDLLEGFPRSLNRDKYSITSTFSGYDVWNCYEFSTMLENGLPMVGVLKIVYPSNSENIVESKSLKLYLNSFNNVIQKTNVIEDVQLQVEERIKTDLSSLLKCYVDCVLHVVPVLTGQSVIGQFRKLEHNHLDVVNHDYFTVLYNNIHGKKFALFTDLLKSNCAKTHQPDWADLYIYYDSELEISDTTLLDYIVSYRNDSCFHETVVERIYSDLHFRLNPKALMVTALYTRRGGIDINPIRVSREDLMYKFVPTLLNPSVLTEKGMRH